MLAKISILLVSLIIAIFIIGSVEAKTIYAGGSEPGIVYKYNDTSWEIISQELGAAVLCLCEYKDSLYAGTTTAVPGGLDSLSSIGTESSVSKKQLLLSRALSSTDTGRVWRYEGNTEWTLVGDNLDDQVSSLIVFQGNLYAGTAWDSGRLYRYDGGTTWTKVIDCNSWYGFRGLYVWNDILYIGDIAFDMFGHYDGDEFTFDDDLEGSCIWDFEVYDGNMYASAYQGRVHMSTDGTAWTTIRSYWGYDSWELEMFQDYLYVTTGSKLERYDGNDFSLIWTEPNGFEIISMANAGDALFIGTGEEAGYGGGFGNGKVYAYYGDGEPQLISGDMGSGVQSLLITIPVKLSKVDDVNDGGCVGPGDEIIYTICYNYPNEPNCPDINGVDFIDYLPEQVDFNSASAGGFYNPNTHTVTWDIGTLSPGTAECIMLTVKVKPYIQPAIIITNECIILSNDMPINWASEYTTLCIPTLTKQDNIPDGRCIGLGDQIIYTICYDANGYNDSNIVITDSLPLEVNFVSATGDYEFVSNTVSWNVGTLGPNDSNCFTLKVKINENAQPGSTIANCCYINGDSINNINSCEYTRVRCFPVLSMQDNIFDGNCVNRNDDIIYNICYEANGCGDTNVVIKDLLPCGLEFVSAEPNGYYDANTHTVTWYVGTLEPDASDCVTLTVKVGQYIQSCGTVTNYCEITGDCIRSVVDCENTAICYLILDDFELYEGRDELRAIWKDGYRFFENGSNITLSTIIDSRYPFGHEPPGPIYKGFDALQLVYDNDGYVWIYVPGYFGFNYVVSYYYSEMEASISDLQCISNWAIEGVKSLSLWFYGDPGNAIGTYEQMYLALEDTDGDFVLVKYGDDPNEDMNDLKISQWQQWLIDVQEFDNGEFNLTDVNNVYIGFGERYNNHTTGGYGIVYFDNIRLCQQFAPAADFTCDFTVDFRDFSEMANEWFKTGCLRADINKDEKVDFKDLAALTSEWLKDYLLP